MSLPGSDTSVHQLVPPTERSFIHAHICICDCADPKYGGKLAEALRSIGFSALVNYTTLEELEKWVGAVGTEVLFLNPHCHGCNEEELLARLLPLMGRRYAQLVLLSDQKQQTGDRRRIRKEVALDRDALRRLMAELEPVWEGHQPKRMGGPGDDDFDLKHKRY